MANSLKENKWFYDANTPIGDIVQMMAEAGNAGAVTTDMRQALYRHAQNSQETLLMSVNALLNMMASATVSPAGFDKNDMGNAIYGVRSLVEQLQAMNELAVIADPATWKPAQGSEARP